MIKNTLVVGKYEEDEEGKSSIDFTEGLKVAEGEDWEKKWNLKNAVLSSKEPEGDFIIRVTLENKEELK